MALFKNFFFQIFFTIGIVVIFGLLIAVGRRGFCRIVGRNGTRILLITGAVGTPIHELGHALMCIIFGHKIIEIKLYQPMSYDGTLGYVNHSYNPRNIYHQIGNFFIGIAPILCGSGVLLLLMRWLAADAFFNVMADFKALIALSDAGGASFGSYLSLIGKVIGDVFAPANFSKFSWWIFIILALMISSHMELSGADIMGGLKGLGMLIGLIFIMDVILRIISLSALERVTAAMASFSMYMVSFLAISGIFSIVMILIALVIKLLSGIFHR